MDSSSKPKTVISGGFFIALEGGEGAGKTTAARNLQTKLEADGYEVVVTREPGATTLGQRLRTILLDPALADEIDGSEILMLYSADRHAHIRQTIRPALEAGKIVISDRYVFSTYAYQTIEGVPMRDITTVSDIATGGLMPTQTYLFDLDPEVGLKRIAVEGRTEISKYDSAKAEFHHTLRSTFNDLAAEFADDITIIDAHQSADDVANAIYRDVSRLLSDKLNA